MRHKRIFFIGCGRVGKVLARLITQFEVGEIIGVVNSTLTSSQKAIEVIGSGLAYASIETAPFADIYFITSKDDAIANCSKQLQASSHFNPQAIMVHCSGALSSEILHHHRAASLHPLKSFAQGELGLDHFAGMYFGIEGEKTALVWLQELVEKIKCHSFIIDRDAKALYHAASTLANNYLVTLHHLACENYVHAGVPVEVAHQATSTLMQDALFHLQTLNHRGALTGPLQRGDVDTLRRHLHALADGRAKQSYLELAKATLAMTDHAEEKRAEILELFINFFN